jgi:hypothetical protein
MSDEGVRAVIEEMEAWVADPAWEPDPDVLAQWNARFQAVMAQAEKGEGWPDLVARGHAAGRLLEVRTERLARSRDEVRAELDSQGRGNRALKGYGVSAR